MNLIHGASCELQHRTKVGYQSFKDYGHSIIRRCWQCLVLTENNCEASYRDGSSSGPPATTASTVQFVSGMSYMAALMLVREPVEAIAYATLVTLLQVSCPPKYRTKGNKK